MLEDVESAENLEETSMRTNYTGLQFEGLLYSWIKYRCF